MVFSTKTMVDAQNRKFPTVGDTYVEETSTWFEQTLDMILDESKTFEYNLCNQIALSEGFVTKSLIDYGIDKAKQIDIQNIFSGIFDWFVEAIDRLAGAFMSFLLNFINKDAQLKGFKKKLESFRGTVRYNKPYYEYRNLAVDSSFTSYQNEIDKEYVSLTNDLAKMHDCHDYDTLARMMQDLRDSSMYDVSEMNELRGRVLGTTRPIPADQFKDELFKFFRTTDMPVDPNLKLFEKNIGVERVHQAYNDYFNGAKQQAQIKRESFKLKTEAVREKAKIRMVNPKNYIDDDMKLNVNLIAVYNNIVVSKCRKVQEICNIYALLFSCKLDAWKEYNMTNKAILLAACKEMVKEEHK